MPVPTEINITAEKLDDFKRFGEMDEQQKARLTAASNELIADFVQELADGVFTKGHCNHALLMEASRRLSVGKVEPA